MIKRCNASSLQAKTLNQKQYHLPEKIAETCSNKDLQDSWMEIPIISLVIPPIWPLEKKRRMACGGLQWIIINKAVSLMTVSVLRYDFYWSKSSQPLGHHLRLFLY